MALVLHPTHEHVILPGVPWATFARLLADRGDSSGVRLAYDRGTVELTMPSPEHEWFKATLTQIVDAIAFARDLHYENLASTTCTREEKLYQSATSQDPQSGLSARFTGYHNPSGKACCFGATSMCSETDIESSFGLIL